MQPLEVEKEARVQPPVERWGDELAVQQQQKTTVRMPAEEGETFGISFIIIFHSFSFQQKKK